MYELQDEIYSDDSRLRLVELNKIDAIIDYALNAIWNMIRKKKKKKKGSAQKRLIQIKIKTLMDM